MAKSTSKRSIEQDDDEVEKDESVEKVEKVNPVAAAKNGAKPVRITKVDKQGKDAPGEIVKSAGKTTPSSIIWYKQWWVYAAAAAVLIIVIGIGWLTFHTAPSTNVWNQDTNLAANVSAAPTVLDLMGGDRNGKDHFYPLAMMIDNSEPARPQSGLQGASVVYEALVEGGITRFMAVFDHGDFSQMGPVRSARQYFLEWLAEYDAAYAHAGGSPEALTNIRADKVHDINGIGNAAVAFFRDKTRPAPHNLYTKMFNMLLTLNSNKLSGKTPVYTPWVFGTTITEIGTPASTADMYFSGKALSTKTTFTYDSTKQAWMRSTAGKPHLDRLTNAQISVTNVIVQRISSNISVGEKGRLTMTVTGTGTAKLFQQGKVYDINWSKPDTSTRTTFTYTDGTPVTFLPGNTWIEVLPLDRTLTVS